MRRNHLFIAAALLVVSGAVMARDTVLEQPLQALLESRQARDAGIDGSVKFYLAGRPVPALQRLGEVVANRKTNALNKSDENACRWVALSVLKALQAGVRSHGANAVVDIVSYYRKQEVTSPEDYECHAGAIMAGVALKGRYAKLE